jgi:hypothetical protein
MVSDAPSQPYFACGTPHAKATKASHPYGPNRSEPSTLSALAMAASAPGIVGGGSAGAPGAKRSAAASAMAERNRQIRVFNSCDSGSRRDCWSWWMAQRVSTGWCHRAPALSRILLPGKSVALFRSCSATHRAVLGSAGQLEAQPADPHGVSAGCHASARSRRT